jgi:hypothetical protein
MTLIEYKAPSQNTDFAPQIRHRTAAEMHERAAIHHRHAALLHDRGDKELAQTHANIARQHAVSALATCDQLTY